jgi:hypothetical protein
MAKLKPARRGRSKATAPRGGIPCLIALISGMVLLMLLLYMVLRNASV